MNTSTRSIRGRTGLRAGRPRPHPARASTTNTIGTSAPAVEHEQVVRGVRLAPRRPARARAPARSRTSAPITLVHPQLVVRRVVERLGHARSRRATLRRRCGRRRPRTARRNRCPCGRDDAITSASVTHDEARARREALGDVGDRRRRAPRRAIRAPGRCVRLRAGPVRRACRPESALLRDVDGDAHALGRAGRARRPGAAPG